MATQSDLIPISAARDIGELVREARIQAGLSQAALARAAGVGRQWLNEFENGKRPSAPIDMILRVLARTSAALVFVLRKDSSTIAGQWNGDTRVDLDEIVDRLPERGPQ